MTIVHTIVKAYPEFTKNPLTAVEEEFIKDLLEDNEDEDGRVIQVPTSKFRCIWEGSELAIRNMNCGRFNIQDVQSNSSGEDSVRVKSQCQNIQR